MTTCDHCDKPAIFHDVRIVNNVHNTTHLCAEHALEAGVNLGPVDLSVVFDSVSEMTQNISSKACSDCGMTIAQYKKQSLLGCPTCYESFHDELLPIIAKVQNNNSQHVGRAPNQLNVQVGRTLQMRRLLKKLESAVNKEEYEQAANIRDQIRELHNPDDLHEN